MYSLEGFTDWVYFKPLTNESFVAPSVWFAPGAFLIAMVMDGVFYPTTKTLQGPDGHYMGAMRIEGAGAVQQRNEVLALPFSCFLFHF